MKAAVFTTYGKPSDVLEIKEVPKPTPVKGSVLVKVMSASVNPVDWKLMAGYIPSWPNKGPYVPGWDFAGVVESVGEDVTDYKAGDEVYSYHRPEFDVDPSDVISDNGCMVEYACVPQHRLAMKPAKASFNEAASIPLAALTAYQGLHTIMKITEGATVLVTGGSGGVGGFGVQIAKAAGLKVIATCSEKNNDFVKDLGADELIDYKAGDVAEQVKKLYPDGVDFVYDAVGGNDSLKEVGKAHCGTTSMLVKPSNPDLTALAKLFDEGKLKSKVQVFNGLETAAEAFNASMGGRTVGKIVVEIAKP